MLIIYVDDGLIFTDGEETMNLVLNKLKNNFQVTICKPDYYIGLEIIRKEDSIFIHQKNYINQIIKRFNLENAKGSNIPADPHASFDLNKRSNTSFEKLPYRQLIGCLMFAAIVTRPDIMFAVSFLSRFLTNFNSDHWNAAKKIVRYLKETKNYGIQYKKDMDNNDSINI